MRRLAAVAFLALLALAAPGPVQAQGADAQGWWWTAAQQGMPALPAPPDVTADDLLVQGGDAPRLAGRPASPTAVAALRFVVPPGAGVAGLSLALGSGARADDVRAYATTSTWVPAKGGPMALAPSPDVSRYSAGHLSADGLTLAFPDVGRLLTEAGLLSIVLVPGPTDRVVAHRPSPAALVVVPALTVTSPPTPAPPQPTGVAAPPPALPVVAVPVVPAALPAQAPPQVAAPTPRPVVAPVLAQGVPVRRVVADDARTRSIVLVELALLALTFGLLGQGPLARAQRLLGPVPVDTGERGIGRFRAVREGPAPRL